MGIDKGARVRVTHGKGAGAVGTVFWKGKNKWGDGERLGIRGDDGETYWTADSDVEASDADIPESLTFERGDRVRFRAGGREGTGAVFWTGENRHGPGQRLGIRDDADPDEAVWLDAMYAAPLEDEPAAAAGSGGGAPSADPDTSDLEEIPADYTTAVGLDEMPPAPPMDDAALDAMAAWVDEEAE